MTFFDHTNIAANVDFTAVQKRVDLVDLNEWSINIDEITLLPIISSKLATLNHKSQSSLPAKSLSSENLYWLKIFFFINTELQDKIFFLKISLFNFLLSNIFLFFLVWIFLNKNEFENIFG